MDKKTNTLGLGAALIGIATALVGALLAGWAPAKRGEQGGEGAQSRVDEQPEPAASLGATRPTEADGPSGPTAPRQSERTGGEGHAAPDLAAGADLGPAHRAPSAFRPDMDAPMTAAEREALRPATGLSLSLVSDEGGSVQGAGGDRG